MRDHRKAFTEEFYSSQPDRGRAAAAFSTSCDEKYIVDRTAFAINANGK